MAISSQSFSNDPSKKTSLTILDIPKPIFIENIFERLSVIDQNTVTRVCKIFHTYCDEIRLGRAQQLIGLKESKDWWEIIGVPYPKTIVTAQEAGKFLSELVTRIYRLKAQLRLPCALPQNEIDIVLNADPKILQQFYLDAYLALL